jgi:hypothetical protein
MVVLKHEWTLSVTAVVKPVESPHEACSKHFVDDDGDQLSDSLLPPSLIISAYAHSDAFLKDRDARAPVLRAVPHGRRTQSAT